VDALRDIRGISHPRGGVLFKFFGSCGLHDLAS
jgi:hypothetical protein